MAALFLHLILGLGQSNALGSNSNPGYSIVAQYPNDALMFYGGEFAGLLNDNNPAKVVNPAMLAFLVPLKEYGSVETMGSQLAWTIQDFAKRDGISYPTVSVQLGVGGQGYLALKKGTQPYANAMTAVQACVDQAKALGYAGCVVDAVTVLHGEYPASHSFTAAQEEADLLEWITDLNTDIPLITGQATPVTMYTDQMYGWPFFGLTHDIIHLAQLKAADDYAGLIVMVGPSYDATYNPAPVSIHFDQQGQMTMGEKFGRAIYYQNIRKGCCGWQPLEPSSARQTGPQTVRVFFRVPVAPLVLDCSIVTSPNGAADGFYATDALGDIPINTVNVDLDGRSVDIGLSRVPSGATTIDYARDASGILPGPTTGARGCLQDAETMPSRVNGTPRPNRAVGFSIGCELAP